MVSRFPIVTGWTVLAIWFGLTAPAATAECKSWQLPTKFNAIEPDQFFVVFDMRKDSVTAEGKDYYKGTAHYNAGADFRQVTGFAHAWVKGQEVDISFFPGVTSRNSTPGTNWVYKGLISENGDLSGSAERDRKRTSWKSRQGAKCVDKPASSKREAQQASSAPASGQRVEMNVDRAGGNYRRFEISSGQHQLCQRACEADGRCTAYTYVRAGVQGSKGVCWLKDSIPDKKSSVCCVSGVIREVSSPAAAKGPPIKALGKKGPKIERLGETRR